jgi:hypothetical protein
VARGSATRGWAAGAGLAGAALAATACGGQAANVALPHKAGTATAAPAALAAPARTPQQVVADAYRGYWLAYATAMTSGNAARARSILAPYQVPSGIPQLIRTLKLVWAAHEVAYGGAVTHVKSVQITGRKAILHDCLDLSQFGVLDQATGRVVPESFGQPNQDFYITLELSGGRWRVSNMQPVEVPCAP